MRTHLLYLARGECDSVPPGWFLPLGPEATSLEDDAYVMPIENANAATSVDVPSVDADSEDVIMMEDKEATDRACLDSRLLWLE